MSHPTNQSAAISALQDLLGAGYEGYTYNGLWHAFWDDQSVVGTNFNERMLNWINGRIGGSYTSLPAAMQAYAEALGFYNWDSITEFSLIGFEAGDAYLIEAGDFLLLESGDKYLIDF